MQAPLKKASTNSKGLSSARGDAKSPIKRATSSIGSLYYEDMNIKYLGRLVDGQKNGEGREFHANGNPYYDGNYQNNQPHSDKLTIFHSNKKPLYTGAMHEGSKQGNGTEFYDNGQILYSGNWDKNEPHGENVTIYNSDGSVMFEGRKMPEETIVTVTEETIVTVTEETVVTTVETGEETITTTETFTAEIVAVEQESETFTAEIVAVEQESEPTLVATTDVTEIIRAQEDAGSNVVEVESQVVVEVELGNTETAELISTEANDTTTEIVVPCETGLEITHTEVVEVVTTTEDGQVQIDVVTTTEVDHVDIATGEVTVTEGETVTLVVGEDLIVSETVNADVEGSEVFIEYGTEVVNENEAGDDHVDYGPLVI